MLSTADPDQRQWNLHLLCSLKSQDSLDQIEGIVRINHVLALHHGRHRLAGCPDAQALIYVCGLVLLGHRQRDSH